MAEATGIQWCDATFNPWVGCSKVSPGCAHCYAEPLVTGRMGRPGTWGDAGRREVTSPSNWAKPPRWARLARQGRLPTGSPNPDGHRPRVFCASLADVFEQRAELVEPRARLFRLIEATPELDWLILTKRAEHARDFLERWIGQGPDRDGPIPNLWLGVSIENARFTWRADVLREATAAVRFISAEPLLGSLISKPGSSDTRRALLDLTWIDWVIVGGESGPKARPMDVAWARELVDACRAADVAPFVKQLGARPIVSYDVDGHPCSAPLFGIRDRKGGDWDEWQKTPDLRIREFPQPREVRLAA